MESRDLVDAIIAGLTIDQAFARFVAACNRADTLFITSAWFAPRAKRLRRCLSEPISEDEALVLRELLWEHVRFDDAFDWLGRRPITWAEYLVEKSAEAERQANRTMEQGIFPWADVDVSRADTELQNAALQESPHTHDGACPRCQRPLNWIYFSSPPWTWEQLCGRAGWLSLCDPCHLQVKFDLVLMN